MERDRFFGLHFDFHASNTAEIGIRTMPEDIEWYIEQANPDFIQCDCKGHPGNSSYPTKVGKPADGLRSDNLRIWCDVAHKHGLPVYVHYSGVWDKEYTEAYPEESSVDEEGRGSERISLFGSYVERRLIPQLKELITEYGIDGAWIDGDCWAVERDYSKNIRPYIYDGISVMEHNRIMREAFLKYVGRYVDEIHAFAPDFKIASNWAYSSYIPEKPSVHVDFLSGDYPHNDSVHAARYEGRCIAAQDMPWDLMAWAFEWTHFTDKPAVQLMQEAAMVLMLGGGFQLYITQNRDGSARRYKGNRVRLVGEFVKERQFLFRKKPIAQVGIFYSAESYYHDSNIFNAAGATKALIGTLNCILDAQYTANIVLEYQKESLRKYDIIVVPQWKYIKEEEKKVLLEHARNGKNLVIVGAECCMQFGELIGKPFSKGKEKHVSEKELTDIEDFAWIMDDDGGFAGIKGDILDIGIIGKGTLYSNADLRDRMFSAYGLAAYGEGKVLFVPFDLGDNYFDARSYIMVNYLKKVLVEAEKPIVEINRKNIDMSLQEDRDGILLNLVNMHQGRHSTKILVYDEIPPIYGVEVKVHGAYRHVFMPLGEAVSCEYGADFVKIKLDCLRIHSVIKLMR